MENYTIDLTISVIGIFPKPFQCRFNKSFFTLYINKIRIKMMRFVEMIRNAKCIGYVASIIFSYITSFYYIKSDAFCRNDK